MATSRCSRGKGPAPRPSAGAGRPGNPFAPQPGRRIGDGDFRNFRHIVAMDNSNLLTLRGWAPADFSGELRLLMQFAPDSGNTQLADPYYEGAEAFDATLSAIETAVDGLLGMLLRSAIP